MVTVMKAAIMAIKAKAAATQLPTQMSQSLARVARGTSPLLLLKGDKHA